MSLTVSDRLLVRVGHLLTMDPGLGDLDADILIEDGRIVEVHPQLAGPAADVIDASGAIVVPGFVDTHRHMWQAVLRGSAVDATLAEYFARTMAMVGPQVRPDDAYLGNLLSA